MFNLTLTAPISLLVSLAALAGVTLHDTKLDRLASSFIGVPAMTASTDGAHKAADSNLHTHVERLNFRDMNTSQPRLVPRNEQKKHFLQKSAPRGTHSFDGYRLPLG